MQNDLERWSRTIFESDRPAYLSIADLVAEDIRNGRLATGAQLPPLRSLARALGLNYSTAARGYSEAQRRGLTEARAGEGTFVRVGGSPQQRRMPGLVEMTMNLPPEPADPGLARRMAESAAEVLRAQDLASLLRYQDFGGAAHERDVAAQWLAPVLPGLDSSRVLICPGIQATLHALLTSIAAPGDAVLTEALTYPGVKALAAQMDLRLHGLEMDAHGILPEALEAAVVQVGPKALYCNPTLLNPTTTLMPLARREAIARIARTHRLPIIEDDAYGMLPAQTPTPLAALAPELTFYVTGLSKFAGAGLRTAFLVCPDGRSAKRLESVLRSTVVMASPITTALAMRWLSDGTAGALLRAVREESQVRGRIAALVLPHGSFRSHPEGFHLWLSLPRPWNRAEFASHLRARGVGVVASDVFAVGITPPPAVRVCLGGAANRAQARHALELIADTLEQTPAVATGAL